MLPRIIPKTIPINIGPRSGASSRLSELPTTSVNCFTPSSVPTTVTVSPNCKNTLPCATISIPALLMRVMVSVSCCISKIFPSLLCVISLRVTTISLEIRLLDGTFLRFISLSLPTSSFTFSIIFFDPTNCITSPSPKTVSGVGVITSPL